jgi:hypothetical protein
MQAMETIDFIKKTIQEIIKRLNATEITDYDAGYRDACNAVLEDIAFLEGEKHEKVE